MIDASRTLDNMSATVSRFREAFERCPGMLGSPRDVEAIFFYIDQFEFLLLGGNIDDYGDVCWTEFLIQKKLIRGGVNLLRETLSDDLDDFPKLQALRRDFLVWRVTRDQWQALRSK
jgi:hypothetical protein